MLRGPAAEIEQQINADQIERIEISRSSTSESIEVRVLVTGISEPFLLEFESMGAAIEFYERLWSLRTIEDNDAAASHWA